MLKKPTALVAAALAVAIVLGLSRPCGAQVDSVQVSSSESKVRVEPAGAVSKDPGAADIPLREVTGAIGRLSGDRVPSWISVANWSGHATGATTRPVPDPAVQAGYGEASHWGLSVSFAPKWEALSEEVLGDVLDVSHISLEGKELTLGIVRGRAHGGDWGISWVRKDVQDGSGFVTGDCSTISTSGGTAEFCDTDTYISKSAWLNGVELHKFFSFGTIKRRVQIGLNLAAGAAWYAGDIVTIERSDRVEFVNGRPVVTPVETTSVGPFKDAVEDAGLPPVFPLAKLELAATAILSDSVKVRASGGIDLPGTRVFAIRLIYFFGT